MRSVGGAGRYLCLPHFGCQVLKANVIEILPSYSELNWQQIVANKAGKLNKMQLVNLMSAGRGKARHGAWGMGHDNHTADEQLENTRLRSDRAAQP